MSGAAFRSSDRDMEFAFDASDHAAIASFAYSEAGIVLPPGKSQLVYGRLVRRVRACGLPGFKDYIALLGTDREERQQAIDALTTNHTSFFRESHHFDHFMGEVWPVLEERLMRGGRVRLWSSASSSGEEPYTWIMAILGKNRGALQNLTRRDFKMLATDLSTDILASARAGCYSRETAKTVPGELRNAWMQRTDDGAEVRADVRALISFRQLNLLRDWPMRQKFDAIFCRNVMIYFDEETKAKLQSRLADHLEPGGFLYIGHSERLADSVAPRFKNLGRTMFQKVTK